MAVLVLVLCLAQAINLILLVDERRIASEASNQALVLEKVLSDIDGLDLSQEITLPFELISTLDLVGSFFLSEQSNADKAPGTVPMPKLERRLNTKLSKKNITPSTLIVTLQEDGYLHNGDQDNIGPAGDQFGPPMGEQFGRPMGDQFSSPMGGEQFGPPMGGEQFGPPMGGDQFGPPMGDQFRSPMGMGGPGLTSSNSQVPGALPNDTTSFQELLVSVELQPGIWYNAFVPHVSIEAITPRIFLATAILMLLTLFVASFFVKKISKPLEDFSYAANRFGRGDSSVILDESGPEDIREAAVAFNMMQRRLTRMIDSQRTMLQAVGHDLRTPLTAMRLRVENLEDEPNKDALIRSIDDMAIMTQEILSWAKDVSAGEDIAKVNLTSLIQSVCDDYVDQGLLVAFEPLGPIVVSVRRVSLKRALVNLIDNALKYGLTARVSTRQEPGFICIDIDDEGPGIPKDQLENAIKPFVRLEESRSKETGGTGLGLSLVESIIQAQGGKLILTNHNNPGLRATLFIPK